MNFFELILLIASFTLGIKEVTVPGSGVEDKKIFKSVNFKYYFRMVGDKYVSSVSHLKIPNAPTFRVRSYSIDSKKKKIDSPGLELTINSTAISLDVTFTGNQISSNYGCVILQNDRRYYTAICKLYLEYLSADSKKVYTSTEYSIGIKILREFSQNYNLGIGPILENGCNCELVDNVQMDLKIYKDGDCTKLASPGESFVYGKPICLKMTSNSSLVEKSYFTTTSLDMQYRDSQGQLVTLDIMSISKVTCGNPCEYATAYAIFNLPIVGDVQFYQVVVFDNYGRLLESNDFIGDGNGTKSSYGSKKSYSKMEITEENSALGLGLSIWLFIAIFLML